MQKTLIKNIKNSLSGDELEDFLFLLKEFEEYKKAYLILMEYWDSLPDEEKPLIDKRLKKIGF
jgi:hypothetical protein